jgi:molybdopterin/thiamine biosynthesis adenylyltransferase
MKNIYSVAIPSDINDRLVRHLLQHHKNGKIQEDLCFATYHQSKGKNRFSGLIKDLILPENGERVLQGNVSFTSDYYCRALSIAKKNNAGLAFFHSHLGPGYQDMSPDDIKAEKDVLARRVYGNTKLPLLGITLGTDGTWSSRFWLPKAKNKYERHWCDSTRIVGRSFNIYFNDELSPPCQFSDMLRRTVSTWGTTKQNVLSRLKIGVVGLGSVGSMIAESLARTGICDIVLVDFDKIEEHNLDRLIYATSDDIGKYKVSFIRDKLEKTATGSDVSINAICASVADSDAYEQILDCDAVFSCVDKPRGRHILNHLAYAHCIPVIDGGIAASPKNGKLMNAEWKAHIVTSGNICLECLKQYDPGLVEMEEKGLFKDPSYMDGINRDELLGKGENVFAFSMATASLQVLQLLSMIVAPGGKGHIGSQLYHFKTGEMEVNSNDQCEKGCIYPALTAMGENVPFHPKIDEVQPKVRRLILYKIIQFIVKLFKGK